MEQYACVSADDLHLPTSCLSLLNVCTLLEMFLINIVSLQQQTALLP